MPSGDDPTTPGRLERFDPLFCDRVPRIQPLGRRRLVRLLHPNLTMRRRRAGLVRLLRDVVSPNGWKPAHERRGADTRVRSQAPLVISGVASAFVGDGQNAVVPGVRDGWSPLVDVFFKC